MPAEPVAAVQFVAVGRAAHAITAEHGARVVEESVVERVVDAEHHIGPHLLQHSTEVVRAERCRRADDGGGFEEVEIDVMEQGSGALNSVVEFNSERVEPVRLLQRPVRLDGDAERRFGLCPFGERARPHVVAAAGAGGQDQEAHGRVFFSTKASSRPKTSVLPQKLFARMFFRY